MDSDLAEHRIKNFEVKVTALDPRYSLFPNEMQISITHNGYQWSSFTLSEREARRIIGAMIIHMKGNKKEPFATNSPLTSEENPQ